MITNKTYNLTLSAMFLALGMILPFFTMQIKEIGDSLLPMHFVIMMCSIVCGWKYALVVGFILPVLRSICFSMPPLYPNSVWMAVELCTYGFVTGFLYQKLKLNHLAKILTSLVTSMIAGRIVWGIAKTLLLSFKGKSFLFSMFILEGFVDAIPGIILQLVLIPAIISIIEKARKR